MVTYLDRIIEDHRATAAADRRNPDELIAAAAALDVPVRGFAAALAAAPGVAVVAEVKRASPSRGALALGIDPAAVAGEYQRGGAAALSVLTDRRWFDGSPEDLASARAAADLPVLRKDFTVGPLDVADARLMGADAVLLIAAALSPQLLEDLLALAGELGLDALVEVHDESEAERAVDAGARLVGVNQRDLVTFEVDAARAERVAKVFPESLVTVAESGIRGPDDVARLADAGFDAVLVGESVVTAPDRRAAVASLVAAGRR